MAKPLKEIIFRPIEGTWQDVAGDSGTLAETLERLSLIIDDKCEFGRFRYEGFTVWYRAQPLKVTITIWKSIQ